MAFEHVQFLSGWIPFNDRSFAMDGRRSTLEIDNNGGDFLLIEYAYPGREEERGISVHINIFGKTVGHFRGFYSFPFYIGFKIPSFLQKRLLITIETDQSFFRVEDKGERREYGIILFNLELLDKKTDPFKYRIFEAKVENLKEHFSRLLNPSQEAQSLPIALLIEPSSRCNMDCVMCARRISGHQYEEECDLSEEYLPLLGEAMRGVQASRIQGLGEPLVSKHFFPLISLLAFNHVHIITFNTNGYLLDEEMAEFLVEKGKPFEHFRISFSLDAATKEIYYKIRGKDLNRTLKNIRYLQEYKKRLSTSNPSVFINMTLSKTNMGDLPKFIKLAHDLDAQVELSLLTVDQSYESIQVRRGSRFLFDYKEEILTGYPKFYNRCLKKAERIGKRLNVAIHKASEVTYMDIPHPRLNFLSFFKNAFKGLVKSEQNSVLQGKGLPSKKEKDPFFENLPLCLLPWSQLVVNSRGEISLCCVQGPFDHLRNYSSIEEAWDSKKIKSIRKQLSQKIFPPECQVADCTVRRWNGRACIIHQ